MFRDIGGSIAFVFLNAPGTFSNRNCLNKKGRLNSRPFEFNEAACALAAQQVALPQRAMPIFSFSPSRPTAPTTTCLPIT